MKRVALPVVAIAVATLSTPASAAQGVPTLTECHTAYYASSQETTLKTCSFIPTGSRGGISISGAYAWGYVYCLIGGYSSTNYGGLSSFRAQVGDQCDLHLYSSNYAYAAGQAWTYDI